MTDTAKQAWLAERRQGIGGSDVAAILGLSPWRTPVDVWLDKTGRAAPKPETNAMRIGTELENLVAKMYCEETGRAVQRHNKMLHDGCLLGNFDRLVIPEGQKVAAHQGEIRTDTLLECKTSSADWPDGVPLYYQTQVQHYMGLSPALRYADVACLFLHRKNFKIERIERDNVAIARMKVVLRAWWHRHVELDEMPAPTGEEDCKKLWASSNPGKTVCAAPEIEDAVRQYAEFEAEAKSIEAEIAVRRDLICAAMGDAETLAAPDGTALVSWKSAKGRDRTDWEAIARALGATDELIAAHTVAAPGARRFLLKKQGTKKNKEIQ